MKDKFEYKGYWFLPDEPDNKIAGILYYIPGEKSGLELIGGFEGAQGFFNSLKNKRHINVIHGESSNSKKITLFNCFTSGSYNYSCSFPLTNFSVDVIVEGMHLNGKDDQKFKSIEIELPLLNEWIDSSFINYQIGFKENKPEDITLRYAISEVDDIKILIDDCTDLNLNFSCEPLLDESSYKTLKQITRCKIEVKEDKAYSHLLYKAYLFKSFIELATRSSLNYNSISLFNENEFQELKNGKRIYHPIKIYFKEFKKEKTHKLETFFFTYDKIETDLSYILSKWYNIEKQLAPLRNHLIESIIPSDVFSSGNFLLVIQALDGFYRRFRNNKEKKLINRLKYLGQEFKGIQALEFLTNDFEQAVDSRDYYSHFFPKSEKENILEGIELYSLTKKFRILLTCCVMKEIGLNNSIINAMPLD